MEFDAFRMDGLGNDFVIIDQRKRSVSLTKDQIIKICDRNFLGCDQLIFIQNSTISNASMQFYNSDGSTSGACGNGTRCVAYLISEEEKNKNISLNVDNQILNSKILDSKQVETIIGKPKRKASVISFTMKGIHPHDIATILDDDGVAIRAGHHCCQILHEKIGVSATARASIGLYNSKDDIDVLLNAINKCKKVFKL